MNALDVTIAMNAIDRLTRGQAVIDIGDTIKIPVGESALGHIINIIGEPIDEQAALETTFSSPSTTLLQLSQRWRLVPSIGIKAANLLAIHVKGGETGLFGGAGTGKTVIIMEMIHNIALK